MWVCTASGVQQEPEARRVLIQQHLRHTDRVLIQELGDARKLGNENTSFILLDGLRQEVPLSQEERIPAP